MKNNYAAHQIVLSVDIRLSHNVVTLEDGFVVRCFPFEGEPPFTQWIGGVIVLSNLGELPEALQQPVPLDEFIQAMTAGNWDYPTRYAWHVTPADVATGIVHSVKLLR